MKSILKAGVASIVCGVFAGSAGAADLGTYEYGGSIKDAPPVFAPAAPMATPGNCYFRGDVGYSVSQDPTAKWTVTDGVTGNFLTDNVDTLDFENTWFAEAGVGCGSGSRGFRGELVFGYHGERKFDGEPGPWNPAGPPPLDDPMHFNITSYTAMFNVYKDLGVYSGFTPYLGAGIGVAYNKLDEVYFTQNPALVNRIEGDDELSFAWSLMAGVGYQVSNNVILDLGYRYLDMGKAESGRVDSANFVNPRVKVDDLDAHEFKIGFRYHFGSSDCCAYSPMK